MSLFQLFKNRGAFRAIIIISALLSSAAHAENAHLVTINGGFRTTHGLSYTITSDQLVAAGPKHRTDQFGDNPYEISLAAFVSEKGAVMIHAERVVITHAD